MAALGLRAVLMGPLRHDVNGDARVGCAEPGDSLRVEPVVVGELSDGLLVGARRERRGRDAEDGEWPRGGGGVEGAAATTDPSASNIGQCARFHGDIRERSAGRHQRSWRLRGATWRGVGTAWRVLGKVKAADCTAV